ncbi:MAG: DNA polymerase III subunit delta [Rickettsiales bacterium]|nr:DNA polymerase III subunit delta [Rickettsiales bacterium]
MIIKSFQLNDIKKTNSNYFLLYGKNEGQKDEIIKECFFANFKGEIINYDESQILDNKDIFFETCMNESLFEDKKIIHISRVTSKIYEIIKELISKDIANKKIILNSDLLEKRSKLRQLFETEKDLVCVAVYEDNNVSLFKIANEYFKKNNISISSENINLIIENCSGDRRNLKNEMNKIYNFCSNKNKITRGEILKLINSHENNNFFDLVDYCLAKNNKKVVSIINSNIFNKNDSIIIIRSFLSRLKRLIYLKKLFLEIGDIKETVNKFKPAIFWKDKDIAQQQMKNWSYDEVYQMLSEINAIEINYKKNYELSHNLIFDFIFSKSNIANN